jgi:hypothetical protein
MAYNLGARRVDGVASSSPEYESSSDPVIDLPRLC